MNFQFSLDSLFPEDLMLIGRDLTPKIVDGTLNSSTPSEYYRKHFCKLDPSSRMALGEVLDRMGAASAYAQGLSQVITTMDKLRTSENHIIYIITRKHSDRSVDGADICVGFLKVGRKRLFILDSTGGQNEVLPVSVLDFYVHESLQRHGYGRQLFDAMLQTERVEPVHLAIDRPSDKLTSFLAKHYGLRQPCPQMNNFVVYPGFFSDREGDVLFRVRPAAAPVAPSRPAGRRSTDSAVFSPASASPSPAHLSFGRRSRRRLLACRVPPAGAVCVPGVQGSPLFSPDPRRLGPSAQDAEPARAGAERLSSSAGEVPSAAPVWPPRPGVSQTERHVVYGRDVELAPRERLCEPDRETASGGPDSGTSGCPVTSPTARVSASTAGFLPRLSPGQLGSSHHRSSPCSPLSPLRLGIPRSDCSPGAGHLPLISPPSSDPVSHMRGRSLGVQSPHGTALSCRRCLHYQPACGPPPVPLICGPLAHSARGPPAPSACSPAAMSTVPVGDSPASCPHPHLLSRDELFYPNKRRSPMKNGFEVTTMIGVNGSPASGLPSQDGSPNGAPSCGRAGREVRNLHDHHQLW